MGFTSGNRRVAVRGRPACFPLPRFPAGRCWKVRFAASTTAFAALDHPLPASACGGCAGGLLVVVLPVLPLRSAVGTAPLLAELGTAANDTLKGAAVSVWLLPGSSCSPCCGSSALPSSEDVLLLGPCPSSCCCSPCCCCC